MDMLFRVTATYYGGGDVLGLAISVVMFKAGVH